MAAQKAAVQAIEEIRLKDEQWRGAAPAPRRTGAAAVQVRPRQVREAHPAAPGPGNQLRAVVGGGAGLASALVWRRVCHHGWVSHAVELRTSLSPYTCGEWCGESSRF